jgi:tetratricopeptide (TPR) repeat protein
MGRLYFMTGRLQEAESALAEALAINKRLATDFPTLPSCRQGLANSYNNMGNVLSAKKQMNEAEKAHNSALSLRKQMVAEFPTRTDYRQELASSYNNLAPLLAHAGGIKEAEEAYTAALAIRKQLAAEFPARVDCREELASSHNNLGNFLNETGRPIEAEAAFAAAQGLFVQLATEFPKAPDYQNAVSATFVNLAWLCRQRRNFAGAKTQLASALPYHTAALQANPQHPKYRQFYRNNLWILMQCCAGLGDRQGALDAAVKRRDMGWYPAGDAYDAAGGLAQCVPIVLVDEQATEEKRRQEAQFYADQAMTMLQTAVTKGWRNTDRIKQDRELDPLRQREDFQKLLAELGNKQ